MAVGSEEKRVLAVVHAYLDALADGDWAGACSHLAASVQRDLAALTEGNSCAEAVAALLGGVDRPVLATDLGGAELSGGLRRLGRRARGTR